MLRRFVAPGDGVRGGTGLNKIDRARRVLLLGAGAAALAGCGQGGEVVRQVATAAPAPPLAAGVDPLAWAVAGEWRAADRARDGWRKPAETLRFFGLRPGETVVELWPGGGWYTRILAPYLHRTGGVLYAAQLELAPDLDPAEAATLAAYREALAENAGLYGQVRLTSFGASPRPIAPAGSADLVLFMRNLHNWMAAGLAEKAFRDAWTALKPGGRLGVEQHRAAPGGVQDPAAGSGYVQEAWVGRLAEEAGFAPGTSSELGANPRDDRDHPFGVWTLPPVRRSSAFGRPPDPAFDHAPYDAVGESDRMTLVFRKPE